MGKQFLSKKGFTMVEIMVVVAIIAILAAVAIPQYMSFRNKAAESEIVVLMDTLTKEVITYYALNDKYPTFADLGWYTASLGPDFFQEETAPPVQFASLLLPSALALDWGDDGGESMDTGDTGDTGDTDDSGDTGDTGDTVHTGMTGDDAAAIATCTVSGPGCYFTQMNGLGDATVAMCAATGQCGPVAAPFIPTSSTMILVGSGPPSGPASGYFFGLRLVGPSIADRIIIIL